jgi:hypothetical protein
VTLHGVVVSFFPNPFSLIRGLIGGPIVPEQQLLWVLGLVLLA